MRFWFNFILLLFIFLAHSSYAQVEDEMPKQMLYDENERSYNWVPTLLSANSSVISSLAQFNGYVFNWIPRGQSYNSASIIDGINWDSNLNGWTASFSYTGMYKIFHKLNSEENFEYSNEGYGKKDRTSYLTTASPLFKKGWIIHNGFSNASYVNEVHVQYSSGKIKNNWSFNSFFVLQNTPNGLLPNGFKKIQGVAFSVDKVIKINNSIGIVFWLDHANQGKVSPSILEAYSLSNQRNYNPSWGWLGGQAYYPNHKQTNVPVVSLRYEKKWKERAILKINAGVAFGQQENSQLDWTSSADPRPDYYRYLPSYIKDSNTRSQLTNWFESNPQAMQINFDQIEKINKTSISKRSFYIVNKNVASLFLARASVYYKFQLNYYWSVDVGLQVSRDKAKYFNQIENLLGGQFYYNYNSWVNDDGNANNFQNNLQSPDQKIKVGENWGPHYELQSIQSLGWLQFKNLRPRWEFSSGVNYSTDFFQRNGLNQNGLFALHSFGRSSIYSFPSVGLKGQALYKFSGRIYGRAIIFNQQYAPNASEVFLDPSLHAFNTPLLRPQIKNGIDFTIYYRGVDAKITLSAYRQQVKNESEKRFFYHDVFGSFVYGVIGQKESIFQGIETALETSLFNLVQVEMSANIGQYFISNNPLYEILLVNDLYKVESGILRLKGLPASTVPQFTEAISLQYQPNFSSRISITGVYSAQRAISFDYYRRSAIVLDPLFSKAVYQTIHDVAYLPDQLTLNAAFSKSFIINYRNKRCSFYCTLSVKNILNTLIPVLVFEQLRFDYVNLNPNKFPLKYLFDPGTTYSLGIQLQIQ